MWRPLFTILFAFCIRATDCQLKGSGPTGPPAPPSITTTNSPVPGATTKGTPGTAPGSGPSAPGSGPSAPGSGPSAPASGPSAPGSGPPAPGGGKGPGGGRWSPPNYSTELETQLRESLFDGYSRDQRPDRTVFVKVSLNLMTINYLDIKDQSMSTSVYFAMTWYDSRLRWNNNENYTNIPFLFSSETQMWRPAVIIENSVDDIDVISRPNVPLRIVGTGRVIWTPGGIYVTHCESDISYYPLDTQTCDIILSTWAYTANEIFLLLAPTAIGLDFFKEHGEWELIDNNATVETTKRETWSFSRLKFTLRIRRRPLFHMLNTLFPVILMAFLTVIVFKLPPESGERIGLSLTILLAFAVYLTLISESIPQTSMSASLLSTYLASILLLQTVAVILTVVVLDIYFTPDDKPVPDWLKSVIRCFHSTISCRCCRTRRDRVVSPETETEYSDDSSRFPFGEQNLANDVDSIPLESPPGYTSENIARVRKSHGEFPNVHNDSKFAPRPTTSRSWIPSPAPHEMREVTWKEIARVFDKVFLYLYLVSVCTITAACMGIMWGHYISAYD